MLVFTDSLFGLDNSEETVQTFQLKWCWNKKKAIEAFHSLKFGVIGFNLVSMEKKRGKYLVTSDRIRGYNLLRFTYTITFKSFWRI